jgi:hypothetical protein
VDYRWKDEEWFVALMELKAAISPMLLDLPAFPRALPRSMPPLHAQDLQNCLCEFDKYERVRLGEGRPRSNYPGLK